MPNGGIPRKLLIRIGPDKEWVALSIESEVRIYRTSVWNKDRMDAIPELTIGSTDAQALAGFIQYWVEERHGPHPDGKLPALPNRGIHGATAGETVDLEVEY